MPGVVKEPTPSGNGSNLQYAYPGRVEALIKHPAFGEPCRGIVLACDPNDDFTDVYIARLSPNNNGSPRTTPLEVGQNTSVVIEEHIQRLSQDDPELPIDMMDIDPYQGPPQELPPSLYIISHIGRLIMPN